MVLANKFDLFAISESRLNPTHADAEVCIPDYQLHRHDREFSHRGGGTAIYVKNTIICNRVYPLHNTVGISIDYVCLEIRQHQSGQRMLFIVIYRPPNSHAELYSRVEQLLESALLMCNELIVVGDFNVDLLHENNNRLTKIFRDTGLEQLVTAPTRECNGKATLIDHS